MSKDVMTKLSQVRRRLNLMHFLKVFTLFLSGALAAAIVTALLDKALGFGASLTLLLAGAGGGAILLAVVWAFITRKTLLDAAIEMDRAFELRERVSTLLSLPDADSDHPAVLALKNDVQRRTEKLNVSERLPVKAPRYGWAPAVPLALLLAVFYFVAPFEWVRSASATASAAQEREAIENETKVLAKKLAERKKEIADSGLDEELKELTEKIDELNREISENRQVGLKDAVVKLSDMAKAIEEKRRKLDSGDRVKQNLGKLPSLGDGPGKDLAKALKKGDFEEAVKKLQEMQKALSDKDMSEEQKERLAKQLDELQKQLNDLANLAEREKQLRESLPKEAAEKEIAKLRQQAQQMQQLKDLAQSLKQCSQCLNGEISEGSEESLQAALSEAKQALEEMLQSEQNARMMDAMLDDLAECRTGMCQGMDNDGMDKRPGTGRGSGLRDEREDNTPSPKSRISGELQRGQAKIVGQTEGKSFKGESVHEIKEAVAEAARTADEAVTRQKIPREYRSHTQEYFDRLNRQIGE